MEAAPKSFFLDAIGKLRSLDPGQEPLWGKMSPQHMVEHIVGSWRISNGRAKSPSMVSGDELERRRSFLFSDLPYQKEIPNPVFQRLGEPKLRKASLEAAVDQLEDEMMEFFRYHESNPDAIEMHPVFGELSYHEWLVFQTKHMQHHMKQFDLL